MSGLPQPGDTWNARYEITAELGRGGFGRVYRAWDPLLERDVAIKMLRPSDDFTPTDHQRFRRETNIAAGLDHRNIVTVYDGGEHDGLLYLVMRLIAGRDLRYELAEGPLDEQRTVSIVRQIGAALDYAHDKGLVHRDVKPGNILCLRDSDAVYLTDFGISRRVDQTTDNPVTQGLAPATLAYAAPEQMKASARVDGRADLYALGCVLFECLTGRKPFEGELAEMITAHLHEKPPRPSEVREGLSRTWDRVIAIAMAKDPRNRFRRCAELTSAAEFVLPIPPLPPAPPPDRISASAADRPDAGVADRPPPDTSHGSTRLIDHADVQTRPAARAAVDAPPPTHPGRDEVVSARMSDDLRGRTTAQRAPVDPPAVVDATDDAAGPDGMSRQPIPPPADPTSGPPAPPPRTEEEPVRRRLSRPQQAAVAVMGVLLLSALAFTFWPSPGADTTDTPAERDVAEGGAEQPPLDDAQRDLLNAVGVFDEGDCRSPTRRLADEGVAIACASADEVPTRVVFRGFASVDDRDAAFAGLAASASDGECRDDRRAEHGYVGADGPGRVVCAVDDEKVGMSWTVAGAPVMGSARIDDPSASDELYAWWAGHVGRSDG